MKVIVALAVVLLACVFGPGSMDAETAMKASAVVMTFGLVAMAFGVVASVAVMVFALIRELVRIVFIHA